jgi:hypothetical protein
MVAFVVLGMLSAYPPPLQTRDREKLRISITVDAEQAYKGSKQRTSQLEETARSLRGSLEGSEWLELVEVEQATDVRLRILGRRKTIDQKFAIGYSLEAFDFFTEDEFLYRGESFPAGGSTVTDEPENPFGAHGSRAPRWSDAARSLGKALEKFAEENYERILAGRN